MTVLRQGLLKGRAVALAGGIAPAVAAALRGLGARVEALDVAQLATEDAVAGWAAAAGRLHALVYDAGPGFAGGGQARLREALEWAWVATRGVATAALIPGGAGKLVLVAPAPSDGPFAAAARAALENLARTLSVEWARYGVTAVAIARGARTTEAELAEIVCFLVSPAGDYFSGCLLELGRDSLIRTS